MTFDEALEIYRASLNAEPDIKSKSKDYYEQRIDSLLRTWPGLKETNVRDISKQNCLDWAAKYKGSSTAFNNTALVLRKSNPHFKQIIGTTQTMPTTTQQTPPRAHAAPWRSACPSTHAASHPNARAPPRRHHRPTTRGRGETQHIAHNAAVHPTPPGTRT